MATSRKPLLTVAAGRAVTVRYRLSLEGGVTVERSEAPLRFSFGDARFPAALQKAIAGKTAGARVLLTLPPADAFGERNSALIVAQPRARFSELEPLGIGVRLQLTSPDDQQVPALITGLDADHVTLDLNPEFAGFPIVAEVEVLEVSAGTGARG